MPDTSTTRAALRLRIAAPALVGVALILLVLVAGSEIGVLQALGLSLGVALATLLLPVERWTGRAAAQAPVAAAHAPSVINPDTILAAIPDPAILLDRRSVVVTYNARARAFLPSLQPGEPVSFGLRVPEVIEAVRATASTRVARVVEYTERVPVERWIEAHVTAAPDGDGLVLLLLRDMTQVRRAERMRVDFVANASHELRTPLASLLGFIETLQGPAKSDVAARERFLEIMRIQAGRMSRLIDDLLSLSRIEQRQHVRPETPVDLCVVVRHVADALAPLATERKVEIRCDIPESAALVPGDRDELIRLVENLVENGIKYGQSGGRVEVSLSIAQSSTVRLTVRDNGPGIAPEHLPRLTERFYRVDAADSREKGGTGLGLALVKHIAARHRARLLIESEPGEGASFIVAFERIRSESRSLSKESATPISLPR